MINIMKKGGVMMMNEIDQQIMSLQPLLQLLHWNIIRKENDLYLFYGELEVGRIPSFINRKGPIFHANDGLFDLFFAQRRLSISLTRKINDQEASLQITPKNTKGLLLLEFYVQHPKDKTDCFLRISETGVEMIESNENGAIRCKLFYREQPEDIETFLWMRNDSITFSLISTKIGSFLAPCNVVCGLENQAYYKKGKTALAKETFMEESLEQVAKNVLGLSKITQLQKELLNLFEVYLPGISKCLEEHYASFQQTSSKSSSKKVGQFQQKLSKLHFDRFEVPSITSSKKLQ